MRRTTPALATILLATLTACGSSDSDADKPAKPSASASSSSTAKAYTYEDCVELLNYDFEQGDPQDASGDPECSHLTSDEYQDAVAEVLTAHKDEILDDAS